MSDAEPPSSHAPAPTQIAELQADVVRAVVASVTDLRDGEWGDREWSQLVVDFETLLDTDDPRTSSVSRVIAVGAPGTVASDGLEVLDFRLSRAAKDALAGLAGAMAAGGDRWTSARLTVERDGTFAFDFAYGEPYRLSGHPNDTRFNDYLDEYRRRSGGMTHR